MKACSLQNVRNQVNRKEGAGEKWAQTNEREKREKERKNKRNLQIKSNRHRHLCCYQRVLAEAGKFVS